MPDSLNRFNQETQKMIIQWFKSLKENNNLEDDDPMLLIIEWNDTGLTNRNAQRSTIITALTNPIKLNFRQVQV
ncbi:hypothetical protein F8M41_002929 [Gigaspora margarita]|uniref:Uncharacterized protein n=1 Tax=Gigaspora margarita TaxID=4874 RepID=A0A8H4A8V3_GIGMA|nr:hypothetical protein F8M41_002929 [Gigaspora margarita]